MATFIATSYIFIPLSSYIYMPTPLRSKSIAAYNKPASNISNKL
jgi:hypothetical protein